MRAVKTTRAVGDLDGLPPHLAAKLQIEPNTGCLLWCGAASRGGRCGGYGQRLELSDMQRTIEGRRRLPPKPRGSVEQRNGWRVFVMQCSGEIEC